MSEHITATERLRALLDERGVEWKAWDGTHPITVWHDETYLYEFVEYRLINDAKQVSDCPSDNDGHCELTIKVFNCTPEQAIAATLGREPDDAAMVKLHNRMNAALLEYERVQGIEQRDGDGGVVVPFVAEMHRLLEEAATLGHGTCHVMTISEFNGEYTDYYDVCSNCGYEFFDDDPLNYCPSCGRRIETDE